MDYYYHSNNLPYPSLTEASLKNRAEQYFLSDYLENYKDTNRFRFPLFFINTAEVDIGTKSVFSPVLLKDFSNANNAYLKFRDCYTSNYKALPLIACVNQGQAFPLINAYNLLHGVGRLGDGGFYENSGTETTLEIYNGLQKIIQRHPEKYGKLKIICITILNNPISKEVETDSKNSILTTLKFLANNPFKGRERIAVLNLKNSIPSDYYVEVIPTNAYLLTRALSSTTIDNMYDDLFKTENKAFEKIRNDNATLSSSTFKKNITPTLVQIEPLNQWQNVSVFFQYQDSLKAIANSYQNILTKQGIQPYPMEQLNGSYKNTIRYFKLSDSNKAQNINHLLKNRFKVEYAGDIYPEIKEGQIEIWVGQ